MTMAKWTDFNTFDRERIVGALQRSAPPVIAFILVIAIGWQLARIFWLLVPASTLGDPVAAVTAPATLQQQAQNRPDVQAIAATHLFGEASREAAAPPPASHEDVAETRLNLSLKGTIAADDPAMSIAIISSSGDGEKVYSVDDTVAPGTTLHAVYADRVILNRGGVLEALKLPKEFPEGSRPVRRSAQAPTRATSANPSIQDVVTENVTKLADVIRPTPYFVAGQQQGYRVYPGRDRKQFAALGLRPGDLIKDIDGAALTDPQQAMEIFQNLGTADEVSVTVERNGQPEVIVLSTSQLSLDNDQ